MRQKPIGGISKRYARALFELAKGRGVLEQVERDMNFVWAMLQRDERLLKLLSHPMISTHRKVELLHEHFDGSVDGLLMRFIELLVRRGRITQLAHILSIFRDLMDEWRGVLNVEVRSAIELSDSEIERIRQWAGKVWGKGIVIRSRVDEDIIGGLVIKVGDRLLDLSLKGELDAIASQFKGMCIFSAGGENNSLKQ